MTIVFFKVTCVLSVKKVHTVVRKRKGFTQVVHESAYTVSFSILRHTPSTDQQVNI